MYQHSDHEFALPYVPRGHFTDSAYGLRGYLRLIEADLGGLECKKRAGVCSQGVFSFSKINDLSLMSNLPENALSKIDQIL